MKLITINSDANYFVYGTYVTEDNTKEGATVLNVNAKTWTDSKVLIRQGIGTYPSEMKTWKSVINLVNTHHITISENTDGVATDEDIKAVEAAKKAEAIGVEKAKKEEVRKAKQKYTEELGNKLLEKALSENV